MDKERLRELSLFRLEKGRLKRDLISVTQLVGVCREDEAKLSSSSAQQNDVWQQTQAVTKEIRVRYLEIFFTIGVVRHWNRSSREVVKLPSFNGSDTRVDKALSKLIQLGTLQP